MTKTMLTMGLLALFGICDAAKLYKWVDEDGKVHYSDKMPPDQIKHAHEKLNEHGVVKEKVDRDLTPEEKQAKREAKARELAEAKAQLLKLEQMEKEREKIMKSYSSEEQIIRLREERVAALNRNIELAEENLVIQQKNHDDLLKRAADKERNGEVVSESFLEQISQVSEQMDFQRAFIKEKTAEIETTQAKYQDELAKFRAFTGVQTTEDGQ